LQTIDATHVGQIVGTDWLDHLRSHDEHQLRLFLFERFRPEERTDDWDVTHNWNSRQRLGLGIVEQTCERKRLTIAQLNARLRASRAQCRYNKPVELHAVAEIDR